MARALPLLSSLLALAASVSAQLINGQSFTRGLAIVDAPYPGNPYHAGANIPIAIEVSGNGKISLPGTDDAKSRIDALTLFLVSNSLGVNWTVAGNETFLRGEEGSTVKHLDFPIPACVPAGDYQFTVYEGYTYDSEHYFSITPIPVIIDSSSKSISECSDDLRATLHDVQQSQPDSPWAENGTSPISPNVFVAPQDGARSIAAGIVMIVSAGIAAVAVSI